MNDLTAMGAAALLGIASIGLIWLFSHLGDSKR